MINIPQDKIKHFAVGLVISLSTMWIHPLLSLLLVTAAAVGKEIYDHFYGGTVDKWDIVATVLPYVPVYILWLVL
jgi:hypothetical protein